MAFGSNREYFRDRHRASGRELFPHDACQVATRSCSSIGLTDFEIIESCLRGNSLDTIVADFTVDTVQRCQPRIGGGLPQLNVLKKIL
jgi:hypothetical protein